MKQAHRTFEYEVAEDIDGKPQPASGAKDDKLDVIRKPFVLVDCKAPVTDTKSYRITQDDWDNTKTHAERIGLVPAMAFKFQDVKLITLETHDLGSYFRLIEELEEKNRKLRREIRRLKQQWLETNLPFRRKKKR